MSIDYPITNAERKKLYDEVWNEPMTTVAKRYNVSDNALRKRCRKYDIPLPGVGYWAKLSAGKAVQQKPPLPEVDRILSNKIREYAIIWRFDIEDIPDEDLVSDIDLHLLHPDSVYIIKEFCEKFTVHKQLRNPGLLVLNIMNDAEERKQKDKEERENNRWQYEKNKHMRDPFYPFQVCQSNVTRVLRIIDSLDKNSYEIEGGISEATPHWSPGKLERKMSFYLMRGWYSLIISDGGTDSLKFEFTSGGYKTVYEDKKGNPIENQIGKILYNLCVRGNIEAGKSVLDDRIQERKRVEAERKRRIEKMRQDKLDEIERLIQISTDWHKSNVLHEFLDAIEKKLKETLDEKERAKLQSVIKQGREVEKWMNPLEDFEHEMLGKGTCIWDI